MSRTSQRLLLAIMAVLLFSLIFILAASVPSAWELSDFAVTFYRVGQNFLAGNNVYLGQYPHPYNGREYPPYAPVWALYPFIPFAVLPLQYAQALRIVIDIIMLPFLAYLSARLEGLRSHRIVFLAIAPWLLTEVHSGQLTPFVFLGAFLCYWGVRRANATMTAIGLWLSLDKFTIVSLVIFATLVFAWRRQILWRTLAILAGLIAISSLGEPTWFLDLAQLYVERLAHPRLADSVLLLPGYPWAQLICLSLGAVLLVIHLWRSVVKLPTRWLWAALTSAGLVGALHTFIYDWQLLMLPLALLMRQRWGVWLTVAIYSYAVLWTVLYAGLDVPIPPVQALPAIVLLAVLISSQVHWFEKGAS